ncbi:MAG: Ycf66 family protein [Cyanobacteria bacterium J06632_19]
MTHLLALIVGFGSLAIYLAAFFFPEVHRKNDFYLSGLGLFYALVLWVFSPRIGGWFFLGQLAAVALLFWFGLQTFSLRRQVTPPMQQTPVPSAEAVTSSVKNNISLQERVGGLFKAVRGILPGKKEQATPTATPPTTTTSTTEDTAAATIGKTLADAIDEETPVSDASVENVENTDTATTETVSESIPTDTTTTIEVPEVTPPEEVVEAVENADAEEKTIPPVEEIAADAELAPPAEAPPEKIPPKDLPKE